MKLKTSHVVIVGAGFAGLNAARELANTSVQVTIINQTNFHLFQPLLYQVATAGLSPADISMPIRSIFSHASNVEVILGRVTGVDAQKQRVTLEDRTITYDKLILATGAQHSYFGRDDWAPMAPGLKTVEDATKIRARILLAFEKAEIENNPEKQQELLTFVIVGAGPTGVELAGAIAELAHRALTRDFRHINPADARVILVEAGSRILASFPEHLANKAAQSLEKLGVEVRVNAKVEDIDEQGARIGGERLQARTILWAAGVIASAAGKWLGTQTDRAGRVNVEKDLRVLGFENIYVIGDTAHFPTEDGRGLPGVAQVAIQQGRFIGQQLLRQTRGQAQSKEFVYHDKGNMATIGRSSAICDLGPLKVSGFAAWLLWCFIHILYLIGFQNRLLVMIQWAWAYITFQRGARLITRSDST